MLSLKIKDFIAQVPVDGLWIDMNEPSNFCDGACDNTSNRQCRMDAGFDPVCPPYTIGNRKSSTKVAPLNEKTLDMDAVHHDGAVAYNTHNLYGEVKGYPVM